MGGKTSKEEPSKPISLIGRSSQRSLFQVSRIKLTKIQKYLEKFSVGKDSDDYRDIKAQLDYINSSIEHIAAKVKDKNREKYEQAVKYLNETFELLESKAAANDEKQNQNVKPKSATRRAATMQNYDKEPSKRHPIELQSIAAIPEEAEPSSENCDSKSDPEEELDRRKRSSMRYGVQVLPKLPPVLKKTSVSYVDGEPVNISPNSPTSRNFNQIGSSNTSPSKVNSTVSDSLTEGNNNTVFTKPSETTVNLQQIDKINEDLVKLEYQLQFFNGTKSDSRYILIKECFIKHLTSLDNLNSEHSVVIQEKQLCTQRIERLLQTLEDKISVPNDGADNYSDDEEFSDYLEKSTDSCVRLNGKPVVQTRI